MTCATTRQIWLYTLMLIPVTFLLIYPLNVIGAIYGTIAFVLGCLFIKAWALLQNPGDQQLVRSLFTYSISYMMLLCAGMVVDSLQFIHHLTSALIANLHLFF